MGHLLASKEVRLRASILTSVLPHTLHIMIPCGMYIGILHIKFVVFLHNALPANGSLKCILRCNLSLRGKDLLYHNLTLLFAGCRNGQMGTDKHPRLKDLVFHTQAGTNPDAIAKLPSLPHQTGTAVEPPLSGRVFSRTLHPQKPHPCPNGKGRFRLTHTLKKAIKEASLPLIVNPPYLPVICTFLKFLFPKIRNMLPDYSQCFFLCVGIILWYTPYHFPLSL